MSATTLSAASSSTPAPTLPEDQLLELLVQLQKSPPAQAKAILEQQPQIAYALVPLMAKLGVVDLDVLHRVLGGYVSPDSGGAGPSSVGGAVGQNMEGRLGAPYSTATPPPSTIPTVTPPTMPAYGGQAPYTQASQASAYMAQNGYRQQQGAPTAIHTPQPQVGLASLPVSVMSAMAAFPDDQREMILRVVQMTPEQIRALPAQEQGIMIQLRATLGMPIE